MTENKKIAQSFFLEGIAVTTSALTWTWQNVNGVLQTLILIISLATGIIGLWRLLKKK